MRRQYGRTVCPVILCIAVLLSLFAGCAETAENAEATPTAAPEESTVPEKRTTLTVAETALTGAFGPFYWETEGDLDAAELCHVRLVDCDRAGQSVLQGKTGETRTFGGTEYSYSGIADCTETENKDGTVTWKIELKKGVEFSDGMALTADDVVFSMYVLCDPAYDGPSAFASLPIVGLEDYRTNMTRCWERVYADLQAGNDTAASQVYTEAQAEAFRAAWQTAAAELARSITEYVTEAYATYAPGCLGCSEAEFASQPGLQTALAIVMRGFGDMSGENLVTESGEAFALSEGNCPTREDFAELLVNAHGYDLDAMETETAGTSFENLLRAVMLRDCPDVAGCVPTGRSADTISGIKKTGKYALTVTLAEKTESVGEALGFFVGEKAAYEGYEKGNMGAIVSAGLSQPGLGAYTGKSFDGQSLTLEAVDDKAGLLPLTLTVIPEEDTVSALLDGTAQLASLTLTAVQAQRAAVEETLAMAPVERESYGYIGIRADRVCVGGEAGSEQSKCLRLALATALSAYREESVEAVYGELAKVIENPVSVLSPFASGSEDAAYSTDPAGNAIFTADMTGEEKENALRTAVREYLTAAGYIGGEAGGKLTQAPEGAGFTYTLWLAGRGEGVHPVMVCAEKAAELLATLGITLEIRDTEDSTELWAAIENGEADLWAAARSASDDTAEGFAARYGSGGSENDLAIADETVDGLLSDAAGNMGAVLTEVMAWGCEVPVYQTRSAVLWRRDVQEGEILRDNLTANWRWTRCVQTLTRK